jgi:DtxR family Mn-dependent transcriptional regulator
MTLSTTEENYLKCIFVLTSDSSEAVSTNAIAERLENSAASVTDMVKKLAGKGLVEHIPYRGIKLRKTGKKTALLLLRKHRLWECFLHHKLGFSWDALHHIAEQLEHIQSEELIDRLDEFLGFPKFDPHGEPIPDKNGKTPEENTISLAQAPMKKTLVVKSVVDDISLLKYLTEINIGIGSTLTIDRKVAYDDSLVVNTFDNQKLTISYKAADRVFVQIKK